jgi:hypothetical protein
VTSCFEEERKKTKEKTPSLTHTQTAAMLPFFKKKEKKEAPSSSSSSSASNDSKRKEKSPPPNGKAETPPHKVTVGTLKGKEAAAAAASSKGKEPDSAKPGASPRIDGKAVPFFQHTPFDKPSPLRFVVCPLFSLPPFSLSLSRRSC